MSIFDPTDGLNPLSWLQEKSFRALEEAARLVDLANEKDTSPWYAKELKRRAGALIGRLAPLVSLIYGARNAAALDEWNGITERGSFALAAWCKKHDIQDPIARSFDLLAKERDETESEAKAERLPDEAEDQEDLRILDLRCSVYASLCRRLMHDEIPEAARKMLLWALSHLYLAERPDVVVLSRRFLPTDIGVSPEDALAAYRFLIGRGFVERVDVAESAGDGLSLRLVAEGVNESKQPLPFEEVTFGFPGARVGGKPTFGNQLCLPLPAAYIEALSRWRFGKGERTALGRVLQEHLGADHAFVEDVIIDDGVEPVLVVRLRYPWDQDDETISEILHTATLGWVRDRLAPPDL